jgi:hypothetical protein
MSRVRVGLAIGVSVAAARWVDARGNSRRWSRQLAAADDVARALAELAEQLRAAGGVSVAIALLPPLTRARRIALPAMSLDDRAAVVTRVAGRYFAGLETPVLCAVERGTNVVCVADGKRTVEVMDAARALGWEIEQVVPGHAAWLSAALGRWPELRRGPGDVVVAGSAEWTRLSVDDGRLALARRSREPLVATAGRQQLNLAMSAEDAADVAAGAVLEVRAFELVSDAQRRQRRDMARRASRWLIAAATLFLVGAAAAHRWGLARELDALTGARARLQPKVAAAMAARDSLATLNETLNAIESLEQSSARWTALLGRVATSLPREASLTSMRADGDSASFDGEAANASLVFSALRTAPGILAVSPAAPIRQETAPGAPPIERWMISTRVDHRAAVAGRRP